MKDGLVFSCSNCQAQYTKWTGRCLECGKWGTVEKSKIQISNDKSNLNDYATIKTTTLKEIEGKDIERLKTGINELDRVLGGGLVPGSLILLGGEPGIGKSTLALQLAAAIPPPFQGGARGGCRVLYISGEESVEQTKMRADRMKISAAHLRLGNATDVDSIIATIQNNSTIQQFNNQLVIIDSIQTLRSDEVAGEAGSVGQVRACAAKLMECAKSSRTIIVLIGQVTKDGAVAGPKTLEHIVDTVLYLEGDRFHQYRILRAVKNRFGSTDEVGIFSMEENGLREVKNPSAAMMEGRAEDVPGSAITCLMEGTRPMLVEIQALVTKTAFGYPQRRASGFDLNRLQVLIGVLSKRTGLPLDSYDVFLNVVGGLTADEPAADLAVVLAIASAIKNKTLPKNLAACGEVGLGGEVRAVNQVKKRLEEIKKMGFDIAVVPASPNLPAVPGLKIAPLKNVAEIVERIIN